MILPESLHRIAPNVRSICVLTGAGISAESGVPTFRGNGGLWKKFRPEELANVEAFLRNPDLVWEWYSYRRQLLETVRPNAGHFALASLERRVKEFLLATQNVDGLHREAGSRNVVELHGNIRRSFCISCGEEPKAEIGTDLTTVPRCATCGGFIRPGVVWFGEKLPMEAFARAERAAKRCGLFLLIGTSAIVYPAASLAFTAKSSGAYIVEINPEETDITPYADASLRVPATVGVPAIADLFPSRTENT